MSNLTPRLTQLQFDFTPQTREIPLTQDQVAIVNAADYDFLAQWKWHAWRDPKKGTWYAVRNVVVAKGKWKVYRMHRVILGLTNPRIQVDHKDGNGLNNRRDNLRVATNQQNCRNRGLRKDSTSGYKGVYWNKQKNRWYARIFVDGKFRHLGTFATPEDGGRAYDNAARELHGEFARLNFP